MRPCQGIVTAITKKGANSLLLSFYSGFLEICAHARGYAADPARAIAPYAAAAEEARRCGLGLNAGHDLDLENLRYFVECIPWTDEVSIGHALICDALYYGLENTVQLYRRELKF